MTAWLAAVMASYAASEAAKGSDVFGFDAVGDPFPFDSIDGIVFGLTTAISWPLYTLYLWGGFYHTGLVPVVMGMLFGLLTGCGSIMLATLFRS